jgi:hypothetical protein
MYATVTVAAASIAASGSRSRIRGDERQLDIKATDVQEDPLCGIGTEVFIPNTVPLQLLLLRRF